MQLGKINGIEHEKSSRIGSIAKMANWGEVLSSLEKLKPNEKDKIMKVLNRFGKTKQILHCRAHNSEFLITRNTYQLINLVGHRAA